MAVTGVAALMVPFGAHAAGASADAPKPPTSCELSKLPVPDSADMSIVTAGDPSGRYLAGRSYVDGKDRRQVVIWDDGAMREVEVPGSDQAFDAINSKGVAVGSSYGKNLVATPWLYEDGKVSKLPGVDDGAAGAINERGDVAGYRYTDDDYVPVRWMAGADEVEELSLPEGHSGYAAGLADDGTTIVTVWTRGGGDPPDQILGWQPDGSTFELPLSAGVGRLSYVETQGNHVVASLTDGNSTRSFLWDLTDVQQPKLVSEEYFAPDAVNEHGWIVGTGLNGAGLASIEGGDLPLTGLTGSPSIDDFATAVSADGRVLGGYSADADGVLWGVRWGCE